MQMAAVVAVRVIVRMAVMGVGLAVRMRVAVQMCATFGSGRRP